MNRDISEISKLLVETGKWGPEMVLIAERANYRCEYCHLDLLSSVEAYKLWQADASIFKSNARRRKLTWTMYEE